MTEETPDLVAKLAASMPPLPPEAAQVKEGLAAAVAAAQAEGRNPQDVVRARMEHIIATDEGLDSVLVPMTSGELAVLALGVSEVSTKAHREHAREVLSSWVQQAFDALAEEIGGWRQ